MRRRNQKLRAELEHENAESRTRFERSTANSRESRRYSEPAILAIMLELIVVMTSLKPMQPSAPNTQTKPLRSLRGFVPRSTAGTSNTRTRIFPTAARASVSVGFLRFFGGIAAEPAPCSGSPYIWGPAGRRAPATRLRDFYEFFCG